MAAVTQWHPTHRSAHHTTTDTSVSGPERVIVEADSLKDRSSNDGLMAQGLPEISQICHISALNTNRRFTIFMAIQLEQSLALVGQKSVDPWVHIPPTTTSLIRQLDAHQRRRTRFADEGFCNAVCRQGPGGSNGVNGHASPRSTTAQSAWATPLRRGRRSPRRTRRPMALD